MIFAAFNVSHFTLYVFLKYIYSY